MLKSKKIDAINSNVEDVVKLFAVRGKYRLIGSDSLRSSQYVVDYDVETHIGGNNPAAALERAHQTARHNPHIFELECGVDPRLASHFGERRETAARRSGVQCGRGR